MAKFILSKRADRDLENIFEFTASNFGTHQAEAYLEDLEKVFSVLAEQPGIGRQVSSKKDYQRHESGSHSIFFKKTSAGITIVRVLHSRMNIKSRL